MHAPVQVFLSNPQALRVEFTIDYGQLTLWWSPKAGESTDCADRNYSSRDAQLCVFESITLPGCDLGSFSHCDYDPYHSVLHFKGRQLHLAVSPDLPVVFLWADAPFDVEIKTHRHDTPLEESAQSFQTLHREPRYDFRFIAELGPGEGAFRHCRIQAPERPRYTRTRLSAGQVIAIGAGLHVAAKEESIRECCQLGPEGIRSHIEDCLKPVLAQGRIRSNAHPELEKLRDICARSLHSLIDESGVMRASLKAIYYLVWVRDAGFCFPYQAAAGWPHKLDALIRLLLDNPLSVSDPCLPRGRMFGQLIDRTYGKLESDGVYYVVQLIFTHWTQFGSFGSVSESDWELIDEALEWMEKVNWDPARGLYGEHFADETPTLNCRDYGWDYAIGKPLARPSEALQWQGRRIVRNYDLYFNLIMHSAYTMLAAMRGEDRYLRRADRVWPELEKLINKRNDGIPVYAEQLTEDGERIIVPHWGQVASCCVWGLTLPNFIPLAEWDNIVKTTMAALEADPEMHWINAISSTMAAVDTWTFPEERLISMHKRVAEETFRPGSYLPMGGAMPEKFNAPQGDLHHDIRPQAFSMGTWMGAWSSLGLRRLPYGLAMRPTKAFEHLENYSWRGASLYFSWPEGKARHLMIRIDGKPFPGTLQIPQDAIQADQKHYIDLVPGEPCLLWLKSHVQLDNVETGEDGMIYLFTAFGFASITLNAKPEELQLVDDDEREIEAQWHHLEAASTAYFTHRGHGRLLVRAEVR